MSFEPEFEIEGLTGLPSLSPPPSSDRPSQPNPFATFATSFTRELPPQAIDRPLPNFAAPPASNESSTITCPDGYCRPTRNHFAWENANAWGINKKNKKKNQQQQNVALVVNNSHSINVVMTTSRRRRLLLVMQMVEKEENGV